MYSFLPIETKVKGAANHTDDPFTDDMPADIEIMWEMHRRY